MHPNIVLFPSDEWFYRSAVLMHEAVRNTLNTQKTCSLMLTGGKSAEQIFHIWAEFSDFQTFTGINFYFTDERWVPLSDEENNYNMILKSLFKAGIPPGCCVYPVQTDLVDASTAAHQYGNILPDKIDVMILGVGEDGHIASLFPNNVSLDVEDNSVVSTIGTKSPFERVTITRRVISKAKATIVLAPGIGKAKILHTALKDPDNYKELPARLLLDSTWLVDHLIEY